MSDTGDDGDLSEREEKARYDAGLDANYQAMREQADDEAADRARRERTARTATPDDPTITSRPGPTPHLPPRPKPRARTFGPPGLRPVGPDADITITQPPAAPAAREQASGRLVGPPGLIADTVVAHWLETQEIDTGITGSLLSYVRNLAGAEEALAESISTSRFPPGLTPAAFWADWRDATNTATAVGATTEQPDTVEATGTSTAHPVVATIPTGLTATVNTTAATDPATTDNATLDLVTAEATGTTQPPDQTWQGSSTNINTAGGGDIVQARGTINTGPGGPTPIYIGRVEWIDRETRELNQRDLEDLIRQADIAIDRAPANLAGEIERWRNRLHQNLWLDDRPDPGLVGRCASQLIRLLRPGREQQEQLVEALIGAGAQPDTARDLIDQLDQLANFATETGNTRDSDEAAVATQIASTLQQVVADIERVDADLATDSSDIPDQPQFPAIAVTTPGKAPTATVSKWGKRFHKRAKGLVAVVGVYVAILGYTRTVLTWMHAIDPPPTAVTPVPTAPPPTAPPATAPPAQP